MWSAIEVGGDKMPRGSYPITMFFSIAGFLAGFLAGLLLLGRNLAKDTHITMIMPNQENVSTDTLVECNNSKTYPIPSNQGKANRWHIDGRAAYDSIHDFGIEYGEEFWAERGRTDLYWEKPFKSIIKGEFSEGTARWFPDGRLNAAYNCVDRHGPHKTAIIWESDVPGVTRRITFGELRDESSRLCNYLQSIGVKPGGVVTIYMPMVPEAVFAMLACARMGAMHNVVFAGFSAESLRDRLVDSGSSVLITADVCIRGGKTIPLGEMVEKALSGSSEGLERLKHVLWYRRDPEGHFSPRNEHALLTSSEWWHDVVPTQSTRFNPVPMPADAPLFMLYTSGSTGKPKGLVHSTAGYLLYAMTTARWTFNLEPSTDVFGCLADIGWITGHTYVVYAPLALGVTTVLFEGTPTHPSPSRYWELVDRLQLTHLYTAPTVLRALKRLGDHHVEQFKLDSLRVLGSVGEPINPEAWEWYYNVVGRKNCAVVDTYWQTETGGHIITPLPGAIATKPGSATLPFPGIKIELLDQVTGAVLDGPNVSGVLTVAKPWPGMAMYIFSIFLSRVGQFMGTIKSSCGHTCSHILDDISPETEDSGTTGCTIG